jgi:PAS domain S-box-containing protein
MIDEVKSDDDFSRDASRAGVPLESILFTEELRRRPSRPPDYERENRALVALASALADPRSNVLQTLAETILDVTQCDSSGLSLLTKGDGGERFYWPAIAGMWSPHVGGGTPRDFGPCGDVLDRNRTLLFQHFERRYPYLLPVVPSAKECLLVPFYVGGKAVGTIWAIVHSERRKFDAEDERLMNTLGQFASLAYQTVAFIEDLKAQIGAREKAEAALREWASGLEAKLRRLVDSNIIGIFIWTLDGQVLDANEAFLRIVGYDRDDLASGRVNWRTLTPAEWRHADDRRVAQLRATGTAQPYEKEYIRKDGDRVPVLVGAASFEGSTDGVGFVVDLTDRKRAEQALQQAQAVLAHVSRVMTMGELAGSIAHEVNQPLAAVVTNSDAALRWLTGKPPNLDEVRQCLLRIMHDGNRAGRVLARIRSLVKGSVPTKARLDLNEAVEEVLLIAEGEARKQGVSLRTELATTLPPVHGDRVQLQQVILNLVMNGIEAMRDVVDRPRELLIRSRPSESRHVLLAVEDRGMGLDEQTMERIFEAFYTTKPGGMGMGLSISRSIVEAHGGRLWPVANGAFGTTFQFTVPIEDGDLEQGYPAADV